MNSAKVNLLDEWYDTLRSFKWKNGLLNDPHFRNLEHIKAEIDAFFPKEDLLSSLQKNHDSWLFHILADKQPNSIYLLNETAELLKFYRQIPNNSVYHLKKKDGKINYKGFQEKLFEIQVNYLLRSVGLHPEIGHTYTLGTRNKEIDILLNFEDRLFNIEVTKYYDPFREEILALGTNIAWQSQYATVNRTMTLDEIFSGYIAFKQKDAAVVKSNKHLFNDGLKAFLHGYRSVKDNTILHPSKKETDLYVFHIEPAFTGYYENQYDKLLKSYPAYIKFRINANLQTNRSQINVNIQVKDNVAEANAHLLAKIEAKLNQHKHYRDNLIIVIAIEQLFSSFNNNRAMPITQKDVDSAGIHELIQGKATVVLLFKALSAQGMSYQKMILGNGLANENLYKLLLKAYLPIRYIPDETSITV
jgi:hypothetical protein